MSDRLLLLSCAIVALWSCPAHADDRLALAIAKVAVNEAGFDSPADVALIWQVVERHAPDERLPFLKRHSPCVLRAEDPGRRRGNCEWTRNLRWSDAEPDGWPSGIPWERYADRWARVRAFTRGLVNGSVRRRPCAEQPITWGSRRLDIQQALSRGLEPLGCVGTLNEGFR